MKIIYTRQQLKDYAHRIFQKDPHINIIADKFLENYTEYDIDAIHDGENTACIGIMKHVEVVGVHSGDSAATISFLKEDEYIEKEIKKQVHLLSKKLNVRGFINVQVAVKNKDIIIIEVNPRASRSVPIIAKTINYPMVQNAMKIILGEKLTHQDIHFKVPHVTGVKEAVFPFHKFVESDGILGPEMRSTGEVLGIDRNLHTAFLKSQIASGFDIVQSGNIFLALEKSDIEEFLQCAKSTLVSMNFNIISLKETYTTLQRNNIPCQKIDGFPLKYDDIKIIFDKHKINIVCCTYRKDHDNITPFHIRRYAIDSCIPLYTTVVALKTFLEALCNTDVNNMSVNAIQNLYI